MTHGKIIYTIIKLINNNYDPNELLMSLVVTWAVVEH